jgi:hypothetical protein
MLPVVCDKASGLAECAERYRKLASETLALSDSSASKLAHARYLLIAAHWYECALQCEQHLSRADKSG